MSDFRSYRSDSFPPVVKNLIIINVLVFLAQITLGQLHITERIMLYPIHHPAFHPYQIATHMFAHGGIGHIFFNMFALFMFGRILENYWGPRRFLFFYLICGVGAAACHLGVQYFTWTEAQQLAAAGEMDRARDILDTFGPALGASGAVMGLLAAFAYLFPNTELYLYFLFPVKAKWVVLGLVAIDLYSGISNTNTGIAHFAHLGGAITGFILVLIWQKTNRQRFY